MQCTTHALTPGTARACPKQGAWGPRGGVWAHLWAASMRAVPGRAGDARSGRQLLVCVPQLMHQLLPAIISMYSTGRCGQQRIDGSIARHLLIMDQVSTMSGLLLEACFTEGLTSARWQCKVCSPHDTLYPTPVSCSYHQLRSKGTHLSSLAWRCCASSMLLSAAMTGPGGCSAWLAACLALCSSSSS